MHPVKVKENGALKAPFILLTHEPPAQYIVSKKPGFIVRWALMVFLFMLAIIVVAASMIRYPEIVLVKAVVANGAVTDRRLLLNLDATESQQQRIREGQAVQLQLNAYPQKEFGFVQGMVEQVMENSSGTGYTIKLELPRGHATNKNKPVQITNGSKADALIIIGDMSLLGRLFHNPRPAR